MPLNAPSLFSLSIVTDARHVPSLRTAVNGRRISSSALCLATSTRFSPSMCFPPASLPLYVFSCHLSLFPSLPPHPSSQLVSIASPEAGKVGASCVPCLALSSPSLWCSCSLLWLCPMSRSFWSFAVVLVLTFVSVSHVSLCVVLCCGARARAHFCVCVPCLALSGPLLLCSCSLLCLCPMSRSFWSFAVVSVLTSFLSDSFVL
jgi:hypothetical protein